jgi:hypothetical protein
MDLLVSQFNPAHTHILLLQDEMYYYPPPIYSYVSVSFLYNYVYSYLYHAFYMRTYLKPERLTLAILN